MNQVQVNIILLALGATQAFILCLVLYKKKNTLPGFIFLSTYLVIMIIQILMKLASKLWLMNTMMPFYSFSYFLPFLYGPLIWCFVRQWTGRQISLDNVWLHLLPIVLAGVSIFVRTSSLSAFYFLYPLLDNRWTMALELISLACYHYKAFNELKQFSQTLSAYRLAYFRSRLAWLRQFIWSSCLICSLVSVVLCGMYYLYPHGQELRWSFVALTGFIYWISYKAWIQPDLFLVISGGGQSAYPGRRGNGLHTVEKKYSSSGLDSMRIQQIVVALEHKLQNEKPFLNPNLSIDELAVSLSCSKHHLSQAMNEFMAKGFNECINQYRVEEAKMMLGNPAKDNQKISSIGFDAGFNSVSSFNEVFKKFTGKSPSQFRKQRENIKFQKQRV